MFCGLLPWTWFSASLLEASGSLISGGNLIKKVLFPAEILPIVTVLANMVHFFLGLPILAGFLIYYRAPLQLTEIVWQRRLELQLAPVDWVAERQPMRVQRLPCKRNWPQLLGAEDVPPLADQGVPA